ncbi:enoyl-CoA hydratase/isomerase family protein [Sphingomonas sp. UV9]|uniref:enoyl-CoA hydratase/isomerase family protein n=1 Tax=Sphingomonas sp. UV9 TaxID=1851410 RepID=UPI000FFB512F|nr:enoyl-CoA hydratase/isomerase family protein [Sphingomonas sp. UV9]RXD04771.1 enoyl-CoA hydratase/isomerase family protein [Sphingomonas sp. UV9]
MSVVRFEQVGLVGHIVLCDSPENELGRRWVDDLRRALHQASEAPIRALVVRADGPNFGTGGAVAEWPGQDVRWFHTFIDEVNQAYRAIEALRIPSVAAVRGKAIGGHFELVLHCDLIVTADDALFHAIESQTGMIPLAGGLQRLAERIGRGRAAELYLLSVPLRGKRAGEIGLATRVVANEAVDAEAIELAERLAAGPTLAFGAARALLKVWSSGGVAGADEVHLDLSMRLFETRDAQQAFAALKKAQEAGDDKSESEAAGNVRFAGT